VPLTSKQRAHLRGLAHHLDAVVQVGVGGASDAVVHKTTVELENHELIKVRVSSEAPDGVDAVGQDLAAKTASELVQTIGHVAVLYKRRSKKPTLVLPPAGT
jgi:RNA-binding protein